MPLITLEQVKCVLQLDSTYDDTIELLIPFVQDMVVYSICNNTFKNPNVYTYASTISFDTSADQILDSDSNFVENDFIISDIIVQNSKYNNGIYEVSAVAVGALTINFEHSVLNALTEETVDNTVLVQKIEFPSSLRVPAAMLLNYFMQKDNLKGVKSESVLTYSVSYSEDIPKNITSMFNKYRKPSW